MATPPADVLPGRRARRRPAWRLLLGHVSPFRWTLLGGGLLGLLGGLASLAQPMAAKLVIDTLSQHRSLVGPVALLEADKVIFQVKVGSYLGPHFGRITKISETEVVRRALRALT